MSKASSCENCIWGNRYKEVDVPKTKEERLAEMNWFKRFLVGDSFSLEFAVAVDTDNYERYINYRACTRFPQVVKKHKDDFCGEHTV